MRKLMTIIGACLLISTAGGCAYYDGYAYPNGYYGRPTYYGYAYRPYYGQRYYEYGFWPDR